MKVMIITTTPTIEGHTIKEYKGLVSGEVIFGMNFLKGMSLFSTNNRYIIAFQAMPAVACI